MSEARPQQVMIANPLLVFAIGAAAILVVIFVYLPPSTGARFLAVWSLVVMVFPIAWTAQRAGPRSATVVAVLCWLVSVAQLRYPLFSSTVLIFSLAWIEQETKSTEGRWGVGHVACMIFIVLMFFASVIEIRQIPSIERFHHWTADDVARIELRSLGEDGGAVSITDPDVLAAIVGSFDATYPYFPNHESVADWDPWRMTILSGARRAPEAFTLGSRTTDSRDVVYIEFDDGRGTFHNRHLRLVLCEHVVELASWCGS